MQKIAGVFHAFQDVPRYARVVRIDEIEKNNFNLNLSSYLEVNGSSEKVDVVSAVMRLRVLEADRQRAQDRLDGLLKELGYGQ